MIAYRLTRQADRELRGLPKPDQQRMILKLKSYLAAPNPLVYAKRLKGVPGSIYRFRVGPYRMIFDWEGESILITRVGHRREVYRS